MYRDLAVIAALVLASTQARATGHRPAAPNIVLILADDLGYGELACYGQRRYRTPRIDRLAAEGMRFTQAYAGSAVCSPSRCALMTGRHMGHAAIRGNSRPERALAPEETTLAEVLKSAGYATGLFGKWGLGLPGSTGSPLGQGFDRWFGYRSQSDAHFNYDAKLVDGDQPFALAPSVYAHDLVVDRALAFIREHKDRPFFVLLAVTIPHASLEVPEDSLRKYRGRFDEVPFAGEHYARQAAPRAAFAGMLDRLDRDVGRVTSLLDDLGLARRTLVIFTSDNGPHAEGGHDPAYFASSGPLRGRKRDLYEGGIRVPMIARWPGVVPARRVSDAVWAFWDVLPTLADLAGVSPPARLDGLSFAPTLRGQAQTGHDSLYWESFEPAFQQALRLGDWKAVRTAPGRRLELYDLGADPGETRDVAEAHRGVVARIEGLLLGARTDSGPWSLPPQPDPHVTMGPEGRGVSGPVTLLDDDFSGLAPGMLSAGVVGAHAEYHYLPALAPRGQWAVSAFKSEGSQRAWRVIEQNGRRLLWQSYLAPPEERPNTHPLVVAGDPLWSDYTLETSIVPESDGGRSGVAFRYRHDRAYYFAGVLGQKAVLLMVNGGAGFRKLDERVLAEQPLSWRAGREIPIRVTVERQSLRAIVGGVTLEASDSALRHGRIGLTSDVPTRFGAVRVTCTLEAERLFDSERQRREATEASLAAANPRMVPWRKLVTEGFGVGRNLRFGDLDGDGRLDVLIPQVVHHGPKDRVSEVGCLTAMTLDGRILWQSGAPDPWKHALTNDVAVQVHDLDGDGRSEVIYCRNSELVVADGATGRTKAKAPTPLTPRGERRPDGHLERILGDSLFFCDLRGTGAPRDLILKDRYWHLWAFTDRLEPLWDRALNTGHYPFAADVDGDGKDEIAVGYSLLDHDGTPLWSHDGGLGDHADGVAIVRLREDQEPRVLIAASDEGMIFADLRGRILKHLQLGHVQNPSTADYRPELPGLETVTINFWGNQGIVHFFDAEGSVYHDSEPAQHGSMMLPVNWTGRAGEYWALSANVTEGGLFDGWGRRVVAFPADGHPDLCYTVLDLTGDCRDEIVVWDPSELWIYTQSDNPRTGRLYKPRRNSLSNVSNYQATVSLPGWSE